MGSPGSGRRRGHASRLGGRVAQRGFGVVVGSSSCQLYAGLYPNAIKHNHRKQGYIWGVYVEPTYRRRGIAKKLTNYCVDYLKSIGCTRVVLNASPDGKPVYTSVGFVAMLACSRSFIQ